MRMVIRIGALVAVLAVYYGIAAILPAGMEFGVGFAAIATVLLSVFVWALLDGREVHVSEAIRDWLVVAFVVAVVWRVSLVLFEGSKDVIDQVRLEFLPLLSTVGLIFVLSLFGVVLGNGSRRADPDATDEFRS
jgi:hypothetical protein